MPETQSREKIDYLRMIGADLRLVPAKPYSDPGNYVRVSQRLAEEIGCVLGQPVRQPRQPRGPPPTTGAGDLAADRGPRGCLHLRLRHRRHPGRRVLALKARKPGVRIVLADPEGSGLYGWVKSGDLSVQRQLHHRGHRPVPRHRQPRRRGRSTTPCASPTPRRCPQVFDLLRHEGLSVGGSAGINVAAAIRVARDLGPGHTVVTILCDGGARYQSKLFNPAFLREKGLPVPDWLE